MTTASDKHIFVTGASTGIGRACVAHLVAAGHIVFAGVRKQSDADSIRHEFGDRAVPVIVDVIDAGQISAAAVQIAAVTGAAGLAGLVNNAGVALGGPLEFLPIETWRSQIEVNVIGQVAVTKEMLPLLRQGRGRVVFIGSIGGRVATPLMGPYNASKFALEGISEALGHELRPFGLEVALVEPGAIKTDIWEKGRTQAAAFETELGDEAKTMYAPFIERIRKLIERQDRMGIDPLRVAKVVERALFTAKPKRRYLVGPDAKVTGVLSRVLPDRALDALTARLTGMSVPKQ